jgi:hypothetical protein
LIKILKLQPTANAHRRGLFALTSLLHCEFGGGNKTPIVRKCVFLFFLKKRKSPRFFSVSMADPRPNVIRQSVKIWKRGRYSKTKPKRHLENLKRNMQMMDIANELILSEFGRFSSLKKTKPKCNSIRISLYTHRRR